MKVRTFITMILVSVGAASAVEAWVVIHYGAVDPLEKQMQLAARLFLLLCVYGLTVAVDWGVRWFRELSAARARQRERIESVRDEVYRRNSEPLKRDLRY